MDDDDNRSAGRMSKGSAGGSLKRGGGGLEERTTPREVPSSGGARDDSTGSGKSHTSSNKQQQRKASKTKADGRGGGTGQDRQVDRTERWQENKEKEREANKLAVTSGQKSNRVESDVATASQSEPGRSSGGGDEANSKFDSEFDDESDGANRIFRVTDPQVVGTSPPKQNSGGRGENIDDKNSGGGSGKAKNVKKPRQSQAKPPTPKQPPPPPSSVEEEFYESESLELDHTEMSAYEDGYSYLDDMSREDAFDDSLDEEEMEEETVEIKRSRRSMLREHWDLISAEVQRTFSTPSRVFKLRGYHSEPDLSLPFEDKFDPKYDDFDQPRRSRSEEDGVEWGGHLRRNQEKFVSCEDITYASGKEHPDLVRGVLSEVKLRSYAIDDSMKNSWWELYEWERKRFSFFDELFAMGYVVDSLEVLSPPPRDAEGKPVTKGEYFVEAEERHFRKKVDYGRVVFKTKHVYTGNFQDWYFEGPGRYCWQDGTIYQGEFSNGLMHGPGSIHWPDGCIYEGHFIYGKRTGWGVYSSADGQNTYAGEWLNGLPHGHGKMWYDPEDDDNDYYEGQWLRGLPEGVGTRQYSTGDRYVGNWIEGMRNGYGIMIWLQERQVYKGEWLDGVPNGFGKHIWYLERSPTNSFPTRHVYQGAWTMGRREGIGKMVYPCGSIYEGAWKNGQRHGKGMFINPAGDILVGLFRAGSILGGSDVPLHAPTYECDFAGLTEWLTVKFGLPLSGGNGGEDDSAEEDRLLEITKQYLPYLRKLYHRAGEYSHKYGKHGLYPAYMKKTYNPPGGGGGGRSRGEAAKAAGYHPEDDHHVHPREYSRLNEPEHMRGKVEKPESLDGVNPVTRFGLWLLIRDCDNVLDEVTMAYYDKMWCETPPLSFQTRHNPFEPVYLWQFLQALIITAVAYFVEIPKIRLHEVEKEETGEEPVAVSDTTLNAGVSWAEHRRGIIARRRRAVLQKVYSPTAGDDDKSGKTLGGKGKSSHHKGKGAKSSHQQGGGDGKTEKKSHRKKNEEGGGDVIPSKMSTTTERMDAVLPPDSPPVIMEKRKTVRNVSITERVEEVKRQSRNSGKTPKVNRKTMLKSELLAEKINEINLNEGLEEEEMTSDEEDEDEDMEEMMEGGRRGHRKSVLFQGDDQLSGGEGDGGVEEENDAPNASNKPMSISECFEQFIYKKLLPCLRRDAGSNLPMMPQPLPALVDMYDAFKGIKQRDIIRGKEFIRSALPHLLFPSSKDALWWHRNPEPLSHQVDIGELLEMMREKFEGGAEGGEGELILGEENFDDKFESEYLGAQAQNSEITLRLLKLCKDDPTAPECSGVGPGPGHTPILPIVDSEEAMKDLQRVASTEGEEELDDLAEFTTEGNPFAENELVPEPFLWADDYKCIPVRRKYQHFENINTKHVFNVLHQLYPKLCTGKHEKDLQFELIFCDWLWCISLLAKTSTQKEVRDAWRRSDVRPFTNPQSLGVYAHYVKLIKNNPYLSPTPPPDFKPKRKPKRNSQQSQDQHDNSEEKKAVKFI